MKIKRIKILSGRTFSRKVKIAGKRVELKRSKINRYHYQDKLVGNNFYKLSYIPIWYITKAGIKNWFWQRWIDFHEEDYFMIVHYRFLGICFSIFKNLRLRNSPYYEATIFTNPK